MKNKSNVIRNIFFALGVLVIFIMVYSLGFDVIYENLKNTGWWFFAIVGIWIVFGYNMIIFLSALKDVPSEYYEAAKIDGANAVQRFFRITLPSIKGTTIFVLITSLVASFQAFDQVRVMTSGGPGKTTQVTVYYIFELAFEQYRFGYASTIAVTLSLIIMLATVIQMKLLKFK